MKKRSALFLFGLSSLCSFAQYAPEVVGKCPSDAYIGLSLLNNGELRHYNYGEQRDPGYFYLKSTNNGQDWTKIELSKGRYYADRANPLTQTMVRLYYDKKVYCVRYAAGEDGTDQLITVSDKPYIMIKPPVFIRGGKRILVAAHYVGADENEKGARVLYSDDDGLSWKESEPVKAPFHKKEAFHQGIRWNHGAVEPTVIELNDGRIWMIARTSQDQHYESYSCDGGVTWTTATPSPFYATITMPTMGRLADGRLLFVWSNTTPLPELASATGRGDDVFTNRNAIHAAISEDDGVTWIGCRELFLDTRRNAPDFATRPGRDKSVHQSQFVEFAPGKMVVAVGQNTNHRKILRFDVQWLYENSRSDQFSEGLTHWSTFLYYKGIKGHCGYDRKEGGRLLPHPASKDKQAKILHLHHVPNDSLLYAGEGAVWNFPCAKSGEFKTSVRITSASKGGELVLNDRWFNPTDTVATHFGMYTIPLDRQKLNISDDQFHTLTVRWNTQASHTSAEVFVDKRKKPELIVPIRNRTQHGISYAHFLTARETDAVGFDIASVEARKEK
ncbi:MAG: sialidase family protein [Bacteroidales bacterium]